MPLKSETDVGMLLQKCDIGLNRSLFTGAYVRLVIVEVDVLNILREQLLISHRSLSWRRGRWRWSIDGNPRCGRLAPTCSFRGQRVSRGVRRGHLLGSIRLHCSNSLNADVGSVGRLPGQR